jgi:glutamate dehydrogenase
VHVYDDAEWEEMLDRWTSARRTPDRRGHRRDRGRSPGHRGAALRRGQLLHQRQADRRGRRAAAVRWRPRVGHERQGRLGLNLLRWTSAAENLDQGDTRGARRPAPFAPDESAVGSLVDLPLPAHGLADCPVGASGDAPVLLGLFAAEQSASAGSQGEPVEGAPALRVSLSDRRVSVHRNGYPHVVTALLRDGDGAPVRQIRILGFFTSAAHAESPRRIPLVADKVAEMMRTAGFRRGSHSARDLLGVLELFPLGVLLQAGATDILAAALTVLELDDRQWCRVFVRRDDPAGYATVLAFLPQDRYSSEIGRRVEAEMMSAFGGTAVVTAPRVSDTSLVRLHVVIRGGAVAALHEVDPRDLERRLVRALRSWDDTVRDEASELLGPDDARELVQPWLAGVPATYRAGVTPQSALDDLLRAEELLGARKASADTGAAPVEALALIPAEEGSERHWRLRLLRLAPATLSDVLPYVADLGLEVTDERPYVLTRDGEGQRVWLYDIGLAVPDGLWFDGHAATRTSEFRDALAAARDGKVESDALSPLVLAAELSWREVAMLRGLVRYLRQTGFPFTLEYVAQTLIEHRLVGVLLVELFEARLRPVTQGGPVDRDAAIRRASEHLAAELDAVAGRDADRILRTLQSAVEAILRTNYFQQSDDASGELMRWPGHLVFKLDPGVVLGMPAPVPTYEIWVYSPRVEGLHLRFGAVARGGLRWSDRPEDFRTEVLGLVKAQVVKNSVIVPTGAKGGFVARQLPDPGVDREAWLAEGQACYRIFIGGLLDVTDNLTFDGERQVVVSPRDVVRRDGDDPYLVVAADKGTATFSDLANSIAAARGFWLGDAFASGGSNGYDHKAMGITARGAWESVRTHFRQLSHDLESEDFTAVGIGDMSGDVFGNGMLLSRRIRMVAAFNHQHVFLDPDPDVADSHAERQRLFSMPRSTWADYPEAAISAGGGVYSRLAKSIPISVQVRRRLALPDTVSALAPDDLIRAMLQAPVDLLWNGGIGTYVKASTEQHADVGDRANDAIRIDGAQLRARVVGEGGNLGLTQQGRIEAALAGVLLNTDAVDNSAGVDCSDHEVNIKVALDRLVAEGELARDERNATLVRMTDDVAGLVLANNVAQNRALVADAAFAIDLLPAHRRFMASLADAGQLDRQLEALPGDAELNRRTAEGRGLTVPELSVLLAHAKISLAATLRDSTVPEDDWCRDFLHAYFPAEMRERFAPHLDTHPLRRDIATTVLVNEMVDLGGITFAFRVAEETGSPLSEVVRAYVVAMRVFGLRDDFASAAALDGLIPARVQAELWHEHQRLLDRATRWFVSRRPAPLGVATEQLRYAAPVGMSAGSVAALLRGRDRAYVDRLTERFTDGGVREPVALRASSQLYAYALLDLVDVADIVGRDISTVAATSFLLSEHYGFDALLTWVSALGRADRWEVQARAALRDDLYEVLREFTTLVLRGTDRDATAAVGDWEEAHAATVGRVRAVIDEVLETTRADVVVLSVALRTLRTLLRQA